MIQKFLPVLLILFFSLIITGCDDNDSSITPPPTPEVPSQYTGIWKDSVSIGNATLVITTQLSGSNTALRDTTTFRFIKLDSPTCSSTQTINFAGSVRNDSLFLKISPGISMESEWSFKGKINSSGNSVSGEAEIKNKGMFVCADGNYKFNMSLRKQ